MLPFINIPFVYLGDKLGVGPDELKLVFSFLLSYPLAGLLKRVPDSKPAYKSLFALSISIFYLVGLFDLWDGLRTMLISSVGAYAIAKYLRGSPYMPWLGFVYLMGHLSINHIARQAANSPRSVDITGAQMVLVMKLSAFCWNVADGVLPASDLSDFQKDRRLTEMPSLIDYAGYVFFFPSMLIGPAFDFVEYRRWLDTTMFEVPKTIDPAKKPPTRRRRKIPRSATPAMLKLVSGIIWTVAFLKLSAWYSPDVLLSERYLGNGILRRIFVLHMVGFTARCKYYGVWTMTEGACILTGLGFNGVDPKTGKVSWNRLQNISPWGVEFAQNTRGYLEAWNINTNKWLRNYVYLRVTPRGKKPGFRASLATFTTSAFWHGFYPGYYLSFVLASFVQTVAKNLRRNLRPFFLDAKTSLPVPTKKYYDIASWLATQLTFSFAAAPFLLLGLKDSLTAWSRVYFYAVVGTAGLMAFFASPAKKQLKRAIEKRSAKVNEGKLKRVASNESLTGTGAPVLGISQDLEKEFGEAVDEVREEVRARARARAASLSKSGGKKL
ncbi:MBOAT, membrane-bound O-acyltransferase family-domain-containing protein [Podospora fimiseda]|uniref:MBOAT, membrane-bound O-acyltransferase family-domain-containing protein n=1 Tax=Podospora fimiseda TaxID=252190 RepID=A0AAN7BQJ1_9PEZI|nr:MBOAT, membrane-bound O-acyltransferase family-domain-containing protein [Podospora fimiseda]